MLFFGRSSSSWGKMTQAGNSWGENVITSNINDECKKKKKKKKKKEEEEENNVGR
jgi:hypothetical protein